MSSSDKNIYFLKQDKKSKRFFVAIPEEDFNKVDKCDKSEKCEKNDNPDHCATISVVNISVIAPAGATGILTPSALSTAIYNGISGLVMPTCAIADIQRIEGDKFCGYYDINIGFTLGGPSGLNQGGCSSTIGSPFYTFGQTELEGVTGVTEVTGVTGITGVTALLGFPVMGTFISNFGMTVSILNPLGRTGLINDCFPCAIDKDSVIKSKGLGLASVLTNGNYLFGVTGVGGGLFEVNIPVNIPFESIFGSPLISDFPSFLTLGVPIVNYAVGDPNNIGSLDFLLPYFSPALINALQSTGNPISSVYLIGYSVEKIEIYYTIQVSVHRRKDHFRACIRNSNPGSLAGLKIYTNSSVDDLKRKEVKVLLTNLVTRQFTLLDRKKLSYSNQCHNPIPGAESAIILHPCKSIPSGTYSVCLFVECLIYELGNITLTTSCLLDVSSSSDDSCSDSSSSSTKCSSKSSSSTSC